MGLDANSLKHLSRKYHYENLVFLCHTFRRVHKVVEGDYYVHACPSFRMEQLGLQFTDFREISYWWVLVKAVAKIETWL
jgi:coenzyme F420-reducing hydrogenase gamma subunit